MLCSRVLGDKGVNIWIFFVTKSLWLAVVLFCGLWGWFLCTSPREHSQIMTGHHLHAFSSVTKEGFTMINGINISIWATAHLPLP